MFCSHMTQLPSHSCSPGHMKNYSLLMLFSCYSHVTHVSLMLFMAVSCYSCYFHVIVMLFMSIKCCLCYHVILLSFSCFSYVIHVIFIILILFMLFSCHYNVIHEMVPAVYISPVLNVLHQPWTTHSWSKAIILTEVM